MLHVFTMATNKWVLRLCDTHSLHWRDISFNTSHKSDHLNAQNAYGVCAFSKNKETEGERRDGEADSRYTDNDILIYLYGTSMTVTSATICFVIGSWPYAWKATFSRAERMKKKALCWRIFDICHIAYSCVHIEFEIVWQHPCNTISVQNEQRRRRKKKIVPHFQLISVQLGVCLCRFSFSQTFLSIADSKHPITAGANGN